MIYLPKRFCQKIITNEKRKFFLSRSGHICHSQYFSSSNMQNGVKNLKIGEFICMRISLIQYFCNLLHALVLEQHKFNRFIKTYICARGWIRWKRGCICLLTKNKARSWKVPNKLLMFLFCTEPFKVEKVYSTTNFYT